MSWCFGSIGSPLHAGFPSGGTPARLSITSGALRLIAGGPAETCLTGEFAPHQGSRFEGWLLLGLGITATPPAARLLDASDWSRRLAVDEPSLDDIDGHFLVLRWSQEEVDLRADALGMRTVHILRRGGQIFFSTRLDWLANAAGGLSIDFASFGAHWLALNSFTSRSPLSAVQRLGPGGIARCSARGVDIRERPWSLPEAGEPGKAIDILDSLLAVGDTLPGGMTLGLSGGLDSRLLLALLIGGDHRFALHVFGEKDHPDVVLARAIADGESRELLHLDEPIPDLADARQMLRDYVGATGVVEPASAITKLRYYPRLAATGRLMIDGGMGEIARRQFGNRLLRQGRRHLRTRSARGMAEFLMLRRGDFFNEEVSRTMFDGMIASLEELIVGMPDPESCGAEEFVDLLVVRSRFPYLAGMEQGRVDAELANFMPLAQPSFLRSILALPVEQRRNGRLVRRTIAKRAPSLTEYDLVKNQIPYPYRLTTLPAWLWTRAKKMIGGTYQDASTGQFLDLFGEDIQEMVNSPEVRCYAPYDQTKLLEMVESYYAGDTSRQSDLDWWLAFETWRRVIGAV